MVFGSYGIAFCFFVNIKKRKKGSCGLFGDSCQSIFIQNSKVKIVFIRWHLAGQLYKPSVVV